MRKDIREILKENDFELQDNLSKNHHKKFEKKLRKELHNSSKKQLQFIKIAASVLVIVGLGTALFYIVNKQNSQIVTNTSIPKFESLGSISPEFKKIEDYYLASIQSEILSLQQTPENKEILDGYFEKLAELTSDYKLLTKELSTNGLNEKSINALINNLQLRLKLLYQLKEQLNDLKTLNIKENENTKI